MASFWNQLKNKIFGKRLQFAVGYQLPGEMNRYDMVDLIGQYRKYISEVFFAMPGDASGRVPVGSRKGMSVDEANERLFADLDKLAAMNLPGVLLFNSSCYGGEYGAESLVKHVAKSIEEAEKHIRLRAVTVISLPLAEAVKKSFPELKVRSSINMHIGTIQQMALVSKYFDGFYLNRDYNRDLEHIRRVRQWCDENGKSLHLLANSGCIYQCPHHHYHENIVAHINEIVSKESAYKGTLAPCFRMLKDKSIQFWVLRNTWIRPEDIRNSIQSNWRRVKAANRNTRFWPTVWKNGTAICWTFWSPAMATSKACRLSSTRVSLRTGSNIRRIAAIIATHATIAKTSLKKSPKFRRGSPCFHDDGRPRHFLHDMTCIHANEGYIMS